LKHFPFFANHNFSIDFYFIVDLAFKNNEVSENILRYLKIEEEFNLMNKTIPQWGAFYLFIANFFATQIIGGAKELVVLL
jgi:hypothetical protein